jgi:hypothetical protein
MIAVAPVFRVLLLLAQCFGEPRDPERMAAIAQAIALVSETRDDAAGLLAIGTAESAWCESVHSGQRRGWSGVGLWQLEPGSHRHPPFAGLSLADTTHAAGEALWLWRHSYTCGGALVDRFKVYGGRPCAVAWLGGGARARLYRWISWRLEAES